jgi:hypothetical protein
MALTPVHDRRVRQGDPTLRSVGVAAAKGNTRAQMIFVELLSQAESDLRVGTLELLMTAIDYKEKWSHILAERASPGMTRPEPVPHRMMWSLKWRQARFGSRVQRAITKPDDP